MREELGKIVLRPSEVKEIFGIPEGTLANLRWAKKGPRYFKKPRGRGIFYLLNDVKTWITSNPVDPADRVKRCRDTMIRFHLERWAGREFDPQLSNHLDCAQFLLEYFLGARSMDPCERALTSFGAPSPSGGDDGSTTTKSPK